MPTTISADRADEHERLIPRPLPAVLERLHAEAPGGGAIGELNVELARLAGTTRLTRQFHRTPLYVLRPIHLDPARPGMAFVYVQQQCDGLLANDRYRIDVRVGEGAEVHLTTQAATKIHRMDAGFAAQAVDIAAGAGSFVEYLPEPTIPFRGSRFYGVTSVTVHPSATVLVGETLLPGRTARGECHDYDLFHAVTRFRRPDGRPIATDTLSFGAAQGRATTPARLGDHPVHSAFVALAQGERVGDLHEALRAAVGSLPDGASDTVCGVGTLPGDAGVIVRILGSSSLSVGLARQRVWDAARECLTGAPAPDMRRD